jgi:hypothetical protein
MGDFRHLVRAYRTRCPATVTAVTSSSIPDGMFAPWPSRVAPYQFEKISRKSAKKFRTGWRWASSLASHLLLSI